MLLASALQKDYFNARMRLLDHNLLHKMYLVDELYVNICSNSCGDSERLLEKASYGTEFRKLVDRIIRKFKEEEPDTDDQEPNRNVCQVRFLIGSC